MKRITRSLMKTLCLLFFLSAWLVNILPISANGLDGYYYPSIQPPTSVQSGGTNDSGVVYGGFAWGDLEIGYVGKNKLIINSSQVLIPRLGSSIYGVVETNITVKRKNENGGIFQTLTGKALVFADTADTADSGHLFVSQTEAQLWVNVLNGNPSYVFNSSKSNVYPYTITDVNSNKNYTVYNLAELATACGGAGDPPPGDGLTRIRDNLYFKRDGFIATPRPTAVINPLQSKYEINDKINITGYADAYSSYDTHLLADNFVVRNASNDTQYTQIEPSPGQKGSHWDSNKSFIFSPQTAGTYEVLLYIRDYHERTREYPVKVTFVVGQAPPPDPEPEPEPPDPGPSCSIANTKMDFQIVGKDVKDYNSVPSGGSSIMVEQNADITLFATKNGTFKMNGVEMEPGSGNNRKRGIGYFGDSGNFRVVFESDDGKDCWEKLFIVKSDSKEESCPIITISGTTYRNGDRVEVLPERTVYFQANFRNSSGDTESAYLLWDVTKPDGKTVTLPAYHEEVGGRNKIIETPYYKLELPFNGAHKVTLERGKEYKIKLNFKGTNWRDRPECAWEITLVVKDTACSISEQNKLKTKIYGSPPQPFSPSGQEINGYVGDPIYMKNFSSNPDGSFDTNLSFSANAPGTWYLVKNNNRVPVSKALAANEKFDLTLPDDFDIGDWVTLEFESDIGCILTIKFEIMSDRKCYNINVAMIRYGTFDDYLWKKEVSRGETLHLSPDDFDSKYRPQFLTPGEKTEFMMFWLDPDTQEWTWKRNGKFLSSSNSYSSSHYFQFPQDPDSDAILDGLYKIQFWTDNGWMGDYPNLECEGTIFLQVGESQVENLLIIKSSFTITPKDPQPSGTEATITFQVKNAGKTTHDTKLAVRWESSDKETVLDVNQFKPGETRKITIPTVYPQQSEDFIGHINPSRNKPDNESTWADNRAAWPVKVGNPDGTPETPKPPGGGGNFDGGEIGLTIYDSNDRQLQKLQLAVDGVWEREPAKIRVAIDQTKINEGFNRVQQEINQNIALYTSQLEQSFSGDGIQNVSVVATPAEITDAKAMAVYTPAMLDLKVTGPGIPQQFQVSSTGTGGDYIYTGTTVPTETTWRQVLNSQKYKAEINGFVIGMDYNVQFTVTYDYCTEDEEEGEEVCETRTMSENMTGRYTITVKGGEQEFGVFEPNFLLTIHKTPEWQQIHNKDEYKNNKPSDWYAGESILTHVNLEERHKHPVSGQYPQILSATSWMREQGGVAAWMKRAKVKERPYWHQVSLSLVKNSETLWAGPKRDIPDPNHPGKYLLRNREKGVDNGVGRQNNSGPITMGDIWYGLQPGETYSVQALVSFKFGVDKGFRAFNKETALGSQPDSYKQPITIIDNALSRILNFTQMK